MPLSAGTTLAHYEILEPIGKGGMGEVYRAKDGKLGRDVAIKVLPDEFAQDEERLRRFQREAKVLASLNHPNIAAIYGLEQSGETHYLVLELVPGETLAERIARGPIPVEDALDIAKKIAEALEEAHEQGIVHRDLKPANVKLTEDGKVKVLDFGLAKAFVEEGPEGDAATSMSPTITRDATRVGVILGTAAYMSPEQARGKPVDRRADIWAFGTVLFEMLTGTKPFPGDDISQTLARVIDREPDWKALPATVSPSLATYLRRCLHKDPRQRVQAIGDVRLALEGAFETTAIPQSGTPEPNVSRRSRAVAGALALSVITGVAVWSVMRPGPRPPIRSEITAPPGDRLDVRGGITLSAGGSELIYKATADGVSQLYRRSLDELESSPIRDTEDTWDPFFAPNGQWLAFFTASALKKVSLSGGPAMTLAEVRVDSGGTWGPDDTIVYAPDRNTGLYRVSASGGTPTELTTLKEGETSHRWPSFLPNGKAVLFAVQNQDDDFNGATIEAIILETRERKILFRGGTYPRYASSGHLLYARDGSLFAMPFDPERLEPAGEPSSVIEVLGVNNANGFAGFALSSDGTLVYFPDYYVGRGNSRFVWVDREGQEELLLAEPQPYNEFTLSPSGTQVAVRLLNDIWIYHLIRDTWTRLTFDPANEGTPLWSPDGRRVAFGGGSFPISWKAADGTGGVEPLVENSANFRPNAFSPDQELLIFEDRGTGGDLGVLSMEEDPTTTPLLNTEFRELNATLSPDGRWMAYESNESGQLEIYVRPFPDVDAGRWQVSSDGGCWPLWAPDGEELFYVGPHAMMRVAVDAEPTFALGTRESLFETTSYVRPSPNATWRRVAIDPDGRRFLMLKESEGSEDDDAPAKVILVQNWFEELERLVPARD